MTPDVSVVIATFNSAATLEACLRSVLEQTASAELIVIDGRSTDGTLEVLGRYRDRIAALVSEPDAGLYDALNKGVALAKGRYVYVLGSDDVLAHRDALADLLAAGDHDVIYGRVHVRDTQGNVERTGTLPLSWYKYEMPFSHQGAIVKRELMLKNPFGSSVASDYRLLFKLYLDGADFRQVDSFIAVFSLGGISDTRAVAATLDRWRINRELRGIRAWDVGFFYPLEIAKCYVKPRLVRLLRSLSGARGRA